LNRTTITCGADGIYSLEETLIYFTRAKLGCNSSIATFYSFEKCRSQTEIWENFDVKIDNNLHEQKIFKQKKCSADLYAKEKERKKKLNETIFSRRDENIYISLRECVPPTTNKSISTCTNQLHIYNGGGVARAKTCKLLKLRLQYFATLYYCTDWKPECGAITDYTNTLNDPKPTKFNSICDKVF